MAKFTPTDPKSLSNCLPDGEYLFEVKKGEEGIGKESGQPYLKLTLGIFHLEREIMVTDYLSFGEKSHRKLWGFCQSTGLEQDYKDGEITAYLVQGRSGRLQLTIDHNPGYEPRNIVAFYKKQKSDRSIAKAITDIKKSESDDDIPF